MKKYKLLESYNEEFIKIIDFYVFNCPVKYANGEKVSQKANIFENRNIVKKKLILLLKKMKKNIEIVYLNKTENKKDKNKKNETKEEKNKEKEINENNMQIESYIKQIKNINYFVLYENENIGKTKSVFYYIRNSFAHGDFNVKNGSIIGQSIKGKEIKGKYKIKMSELINWIEIIVNFK